MGRRLGAVRVEGRDISVSRCACEVAVVVRGGGRVSGSSFGCGLEGAIFS